MGKGATAKGLLEGPMKEEGGKDGRYLLLFKAKGSMHNGSHLIICICLLSPLRPLGVELPPPHLATEEDKHINICHLSVRPDDCCDCGSELGSAIILSIELVQ